MFLSRQFEGGFLKNARQFIVPIYQRTYSWTEKECRQLWNDILRTGTNDHITVHFVGSIVYIAQADDTVTTWQPLLVIDGQQRLTTVTLLIAALAKALGDTEPMDGFSVEKLRGYYLLNQYEKNERKFKLLLSQTDRTTLTAIISGQEHPKEFSRRVAANFQLFEELIAASGDQLVDVCKGLAKLMMVDIKLKRGEDNPQLIFESMNSTGKELSQADLIRNYISDGAGPRSANKALRKLLATDGSRLRPGSLRHAFRRFHASLPHRQDRRDPPSERSLRCVQSSCGLARCCGRPHSEC